MGDEDWEAEIIKPHMSSYVPVFEKDRYSSGANGDTYNRTPASSSEMDDGSSRRDHFMRSGFASGRSLGNRDPGESNKRENTSTMGGFGVGKSFGNRGFSNNKFEEGDSSGFWRESNNDCEDNQTRNRGFSKRGGFQDGNDSEASVSSRRGGRGSFRGCRGRFGLGSPNSEYEQDEGTHRTGGFFGSRRSALSGAGNGDTYQSRSGSGSGRGGYKGLNEEVITGSGKNSWKSEAEGGESGDIQGPKVTYIPPPPPEDEDSIFAHYQTGINFDKYDTILVEVSGHEAPPAILTFEEANLCQTLNSNIAKAGYTKLTPVQKYSIPIILGGRDLMACAQTGSGKTAAFLLPILAHMMRDGITASRFKELQEPECIIVAPTRELINQIYLEARKFSFGTCVRAVVIYGGTQLGHSIRQIVQGCNILCATPGRLMDIIGKEKIGLRQVKYLVLDEADRMLDMGFGPEMKKLISCPGMPSKEQRQTLMFSATFPEEIQRLAGEFLKSNYLFVAVGQVGGACRDVQQTILQVGQYSKREKLVEILRNIGDERTMVFVETKKKADFIATFLCQEKISTTSIHGDREQREREQALGDFRCGKCPVLVATSVAARGLDIENVQHVINFDLPSTIDEYVHRIGRTGRCGNTGRAISFFDPESDSHLAQPLVKVLSDAQQDVPAWLEEIAFSTYVPGFSGSSRGNVFASVDTRKPSCVILGTMWAWVPWMLPLLYKFGLAVLPAKPENISCIFYYKKNFTCTWSPEKEANFTWYTVKRTYIYGRISDTCNSTSERGSSCSFLYPRISIPDYSTIQVEAQNADGIIESDITHWNLNTVIKTEPPEISSVKPILGIKRMVQIKWARPVLAPVHSTLKYTLRFRMVDSAHWMEVNFMEGVFGEETFNLTGLQAFTEYVIALRCVAEGSRFWSDWSLEKMGITEEEAPHGLDLWRVLRPAKVDGRRPVQLLWKKAKGAPVLEKALGYNIWYFPENSTNLTETMNTTNQQLDLCLGGKTYWIYVISYNSHGDSPVATLRIPAIDEKSFQCIEAMQASLTQDLLVVEWQSSALEVDSWIVEWVPDMNSEPSTISWESVSGARNWTIQKDELKPFWCYNISVYPMLGDRVGEPYSIQAYVKEGVPLKGPTTRAENIGVKTVTIAWEEIPKNQRYGFINNYTIFYQAEDGKEFSKTVNASILQYNLESLTRKTSYTVQVMASTSAGGINGSSINFKTLSISVFEIFLRTSLVGGGLLILIILTVAYGLKKPNKLKHLCWPTVPNPAESSIAMWHGNDFKNKLNLKFNDSVNTEEDRILKLCSAPSDFIDKLVVTFENVLEELSTEEPEKGQENTLGGEKNEYVTSPYRPYCPPVSTETPPRRSQHPCSGMPEGTCSEAREQHLPSAQSLGPDHLCVDGSPNPYLKNSVTTREFLVSEKLPDQTQGEP